MVTQVAWDPHTSPRSCVEQPPCLSPGETKARCGTPTITMGTHSSWRRAGAAGPKCQAHHPHTLPPFSPPFQLTMNDFSVHRIIGRGGFGEVYGCRKADTGKM